MNERYISSLLLLLRKFWYVVLLARNIDYSKKEPFILLFQSDNINAYISVTVWVTASFPFILWGNSNANDKVFYPQLIPFCFFPLLQHAVQEERVNSILIGRRTEPLIVPDNDEMPLSRQTLKHNENKQLTPPHTI